MSTESRKAFVIRHILLRAAILIMRMATTCRNDNYYQKYLRGVYGAVPQLG